MASYECVRYFCVLVTSHLFLFSISDVIVKWSGRLLLWRHSLDLSCIRHLIRTTVQVSHRAKKAFFVQKIHIKILLNNILVYVRSVRLLFNFCLSAQCTWTVTTNSVKMFVKWKHSLLPIVNPLLSVRISNFIHSCVSSVN